MNAVPRVEVTAGGEIVQVSGTLIEDLREGSSFRAWIEHGGGRAPAPCDLVEVVVEEAVHRLWNTECAAIEDERGARFEMLAMDPLLWADRGRQFMSHQGRVPLLRLADSVVSGYAGGLPGLEASSGPSPSIESEWMLQCRETGKEFLDRAAATCGAVLFWNRTGLAAASIGQGVMDGNGPRVLPRGDRRLGLRLTRGAGLPGHTAHWIDPVTRRARSLKVNATQGPLPSAARLATRLPGAVRPEAPAIEFVPGGTPAGDHAIVETSMPGIQLGESIQIPEAGGFTGVVDRIEHRLTTAGSYGNTIRLVPRQLWGLTGGGLGVHQTGFFQAVVTDNNDPDRLGRLRVVIAEDVHRRATPWIHSLTPYGGNGTGLYMMPEKGDLVMVHADSVSASGLLVVGSIRWDGGRAGADWSDGGNGLKVLGVRGGVSLILDDRQGSLLLQTPRCQLELGGDGTLKARAGSFDLKAQGKVLIDGSALFLGE